MYRQLYKFHQSYYLDKANRLKRLISITKEELRDTVNDIYTIFSDKLIINEINILIDYDNIKSITKIGKVLKSMTCITKEDMHFKYLLSKINSLIANHRNYCNEYKINLEIKNIPFNIFKYIIDKNNEINQYNVLRGKKWYLGLNLGYIQIMRTKRKFHSEDKDNIISINWGQSVILLKEIAKLQEDNGLHNLYSKLINKEIEYPTFAKCMKQYTYSIEHPELPKYMVYNTSDSYNWWYWRYKNKYVKNISAYKFRPTSYINTKERVYESILSTVTDTKEIINHKYLGNMDKVLLCCSINPNYSLNFDLHE